MRVLSVNTLNLDKLYKTCAFQVNETNNVKFGSNIFELYNNIEISFGLSDVTPIDAFFLKEITTKTTKLVDLEIDSDNLDYDTNVRRYAKYVRNIMEDSSVKSDEKWDYPFLYGPAHILKGKMGVSISGSDLVSILGNEPSDFFLKATSGTCADNVSGPISFKTDFDLNDSNISAFLAKLFLDSFNRRMKNRFSLIDEISDTGINKYFVQHESLIKLKSVRNPYLVIDFKNTESKVWKKDVDNYKELMSSSFYKEINNDILKITEFEVECYSNLSTLIELYLALPKRFFITVEDFRIPFSFKDIYIPSDYPEKIAATLTRRYEEMQTSIDTLQSSAYDKISHTYLNSKISYTMKLSLEDINLYINQLMKNKSLSVESISILVSILKFAKSIYSSIN